MFIVLAIKLLFFYFQSVLAFSLLDFLCCWRKENIETQLIQNELDERNSGSNETINTYVDINPITRNPIIFDRNSSNFEETAV
jgi:hypothetical protein